MGLSDYLLNKFEDLMYEPSSAKIKRENLLDKEIFKTRLDEFRQTDIWRHLARDIEEYESTFDEDGP
jgi:hypothetical protein